MDDEDELFVQYYLLYKLKNSEILWVVKVSVDYSELKYYIRKCSSDSEKYYIVSKEVPYSELSLKCKQFTQFHYYIHYETTIQ